MSEVDILLIHTWLSDTAAVEWELELDILRLDHLITLVGTGYGG